MLQVDNVIETISSLQEQIKNKGYKEDPTFYIEEGYKLFNRFLGNSTSFYKYLQDNNDSKYTYSVKSSLIILQEIYDSIYLGKRVNFYKYKLFEDYTSDVKLSNTIKFKVDLKPQLKIADKRLDYVNLLQVNGIEQTFQALSLLYSKIYIYKAI